MVHVLVVDDSKFSRGRIVSALVGAEFEISEAENGAQALEFIEAAPPDLIISDLLMPQLNGFQLLTEVRQRSLPIPVIVVSADIQTSSQAACRDLGVSGFLNKPFKPEELTSLVRAALTGVAAEG